MDISIQDQRQGGTKIFVDTDLVEAYCGIAGVDLTKEGTLKIRFRSGNGPYGYMKRTKDGYRVVINIRNKKTHLSDRAKYVVSNTLLHEITHVAQAQGSMPLDPDYNGWSEVEARKVGKTIEGNTDLYAVR